MELLSGIRWILLAAFILLFYEAEIKKKKVFQIPAHLAFLGAIFTHAIVRDWPMIVKGIILFLAVIGVGGNIAKNLMEKKVS